MYSSVPLFSRVERRYPVVGAEMPKSVNFHTRGFLRDRMTTRQYLSLTGSKEGGFVLGGNTILGF